MSLRHDPGGKVRLRLQQGIFGRADFSICGRYRHSLWRFDGATLPAEPFALWIGMNPSTAESDVDDPTCRKEQGFTWRMGLRSYGKVNVMDYRATYPRDLLRPGVEPCSTRNLPIILELAQSAATVIAAWGVLPPSLRYYADIVERELKIHQVPLFCLGRTNAGAPRHPLYLRGDSPLQPFL